MRLNFVNLFPYVPVACLRLENIHVQNIHIIRVGTSDLPQVPKENTRISEPERET